MFIFEGIEGVCVVPREAGKGFGVSKESGFTDDILVRLGKGVP